MSPIEGNMEYEPDMVKGEAKVLVRRLMNHCEAKMGPGKVNDDI